MPVREPFAEVGDLPMAPPLTVSTASAFPDSINHLSLQEISDAMQAAAALVSWAESLMAEVEARYIDVTERQAHELELAVVKYREEEPDETRRVGKTVASLRAHVIESNAVLKAREEERWTLRSNKHRLEHLLVAYTTARDTLSRQIEIKKMEQGTR